MLINPKKMVSISEANQNFSKVAKIVDENKSIVIVKNNKPKYVIIDFEEFSRNSMDEEKLDEIADRVLRENMIAFEELAK